MRFVGYLSLNVLFLNPAHYIKGLRGHCHLYLKERLQSKNKTHKVL